MAVEILYRDPQMIVCIKPAGADSEHDMPRLLTEQLSLKQCFCVHRLDREAAGVMVYALDGKSAAILTAEFSDHTAHKEYLALCSGLVEPEADTLTDLLYHDTRTNRTFVTNRMRKGVREAVLHYQRTGTADTSFGPVSCLRIHLETGRSHQIRVQFASRKHPLLGDRRYGSGAALPKGIALWSRSLTVIHPRSKKELTFTCEAPGEAPWDQLTG